MDDDLILPESDITDFVDPTPPKKNKKTTIIILAAVVAFICLAGALIFVLLNKDSNENTQTQDTTEDSSARYDSQEFNKAMTLAEERLEIRDYVGVEYYTKQYSIPELMTLAQKYRYYSLLATLYSEDYLDDSELFSKYTSIADSTLKSIRKGEE